MDSNSWNGGGVCEACGISFCADHRPGNTLERVECRIDAFDTRGLLVVPANGALDACWALDHYSDPWSAKTKVGTRVAAAKGYERELPDSNAGRELGRVLGKFMASLAHPTIRSTPLRTLLDVDGIVPIPSPRQRHDMCDPMDELPAILAEEIAYATGTSFLLGALEAGRAGQKMKNLDQALRPRAIHGAFSTDFEFPEGTKLLIVDDVVQTQATMNEAARVLRAAGAARVTGLAAAISGAWADHGESSSTAA